MILAGKPGQPGPRVEKRAPDIKFVQVDCSGLLQPNELIYGEVQYSGNDALVITEARTKTGKYIQFKCSEGGPASGSADYRVVFLVKTSFGSTISVLVTIRVFAQ